MKTKHLSPIIAALVLLAAGNSRLSIAFAQGSLTPPGAPAPTMKTLDQLDAKLEKRTPISSLPITITNAGSYYLITNVIGASATTGITISTNNVSIDLNGFTLQGVPTATTAVYIPNPCTNITLCNGAISGWGNNGVFAPTCYNMVCERLTIQGIANFGIQCLGSGRVEKCLVQTANATSFASVYVANTTVSDCTISAITSGGLNVDSNCVVTGCFVTAPNGNAIIAKDSSVSHCMGSGGGYGIYGHNCNISDCTAESVSSSGINASASTISRCMARSIGSFGIYATMCAISDCMVVNGSAGIHISYGTASGCTVQACTGRGIQAGNSTVSGCVVSGCTNSGIYALYSPCQILNNTCFGNNGSGNTNEAGIYVYASTNRIENNQVSGSGYAGISLTNTSSGNLVIRNTVTGNGSRNYVTNTVSAFGPIITSSGTITNLNPWANFSY